MKKFHMPIILICNGNNKLSLSIDDIINRIITLKQNLNYTLKDVKNEQNLYFDIFEFSFFYDEKINNKLKVLFFKENCYIGIYDDIFDKIDIDTNKSYIRRLSKKMNLNIIDMFYLDDNKIKVELYDFNKRIYDYFIIGEDKKSIINFKNKNLLKNYFVGKNTFDDIIKIFHECYYTNNYQILQDMFKLFGIDLKKLVQAIE